MVKRKKLKSNQNDSKTNALIYYLLALLPCPPKEGGKTRQDRKKKSVSPSCIPSLGWQVSPSPRTSFPAITPHPSGKFLCWIHLRKVFATGLAAPSLVCLPQPTPSLSHQHALLKSTHKPLTPNCRPQNTCCHHFSSIMRHQAVLKLELNNSLLSI